MNSLFCRKKLYYSDGIQTFWTRCSCFCFVFLPAAITRCYYSLSSVIRFLRPNKRKLPNLTVIKNKEQREGTFRICARYPLNQLKFKDLAGESGHVVVLGERIDRCVLFCLKFSKASYVDKFLIRCSAFHPIQGLFYERRAVKLNNTIKFANTNWVWWISNFSSIWNICRNDILKAITFEK